MQFRNPCKGRDEGSMEDAVVFLRRSPMVPQPSGAEGHLQLTRWLLPCCDEFAWLEYYWLDGMVVFCQADLYGIVAFPDGCVIHSERLGQTGFLLVLFGFFISERVLRYDSPWNLMKRQCWTMRAMTAGANSSHRTRPPHRTYSLFELNTTLLVSRLSDMTWNRRRTPSMSMGR